MYAYINLKDSNTTSLAVISRTVVEQNLCEDDTMRTTIKNFLKVGHCCIILLHDDQTDDRF